MERSSGTGGFQTVLIRCRPELVWCGRWDPAHRPPDQPETGTHGKPPDGDRQLTLGALIFKIWRDRIVQKASVEIPAVVWMCTVLHSVESRSLLRSLLISEVIHVRICRIVLA